MVTIDRRYDPAISEIFGRSSVFSGNNVRNQSLRAMARPIGATALFAETTRALKSPAVSTTVPAWDCPVGCGCCCCWCCCHATVGNAAVFTCANGAAAVTDEDEDEEEDEEVVAVVARNEVAPTEAVTPGVKWQGWSRGCTSHTSLSDVSTARPITPDGATVAVAAVVVAGALVVRRKKANDVTLLAKATRSVSSGVAETGLNTLTVWHCGRRSTPSPSPSSSASVSPSLPAEVAAAAAVAVAVVVAMAIQPSSANDERKRCCPSMAAVKANCSLDAVAMASTASPSTVHNSCCVSSEKTVTEALVPATR